MIEILFRGKTKQRNWVEGNGIMQGQDCISHARWVDICNDRTRYEVIPETVGRFTGLTDKNGKKIFEGDIVKENDIFHNGELQIKGNAWRVVFADGLFFGNFNDISVYLQSLDGMEVIGNIHDNPELLEQGR